MLKGKALYGAACYTNLKTRKWVAVGLLLSSYKIFHESLLIKKLKLLKANYGKDEKSFKRIAKIIQTIKNPIVDITRICICFENYLKVELLLKGYIIHNIDAKVKNKKYKSLAKKQKTQPIRISEIKKKEGLIGKKGNLYDFESLLETTIGFKTMFSKQAYRNQLRFPAKLFDILEQVNRKRNTLHCLLDTSYSYSESTIDDYIFLKSIVNNRLARKHNSLCNFLGFNNLLVKKNT